MMKLSMEEHRVVCSIMTCPQFSTTSDMELPSPSSTTTATTVDAFGSSSSSSSGSSDAMLDINSVDMPFDAWLTPFNNKPEEELLPSPPESASQGDENELGFGYLPWVLPPQLPPFSPPPAIIARGGCDDHREIGVPSEHESPKTIDGTPATVEDNEIVEVKAKTDTSSFVRLPCSFLNWPYPTLTQ